LTKASVQFDSLYVDGVQVSTSTNTENMAANQTFGNNTLYLMSDGGAGTYSAGRLMNFNIHAGTGAIGLGDIGALYRAPWSMFRAAAPLYTSPDAPAAQPAAAQYRHFLCM